MADWQSLDPEAAREAEKYENPIPSRELILKHLDERGSPATREQLLSEFGLESEDEVEALRRRLRAMERDGQLIYTRRGAYAPVDKLDLICGRVSGHRDGFGFLIPDDGSADLFLSPKQMHLLFDGDRCLARVSGYDRRGRREGAVVEVISRAHERLVGRYYTEHDVGFVIPDNPKLQQQEILITPGRDLQARAGQFVEVKITHWPTHRFQSQGDICEIIGNYLAPGMEIDVALRSFDIPHQWPEAVEHESAAFKAEVTPRDKVKRVDLRHLPLVTIDGEDARDFDDAVFCERPAGIKRLAGGFRLYVAIADVSHYVKVDSALDLEAQKRGNSVYFPERVIPMLPEALSNGLCSLNPAVDRLAMVCEINLTRTGKVVNYQFYEAVIHSHARLTYDKVNTLLTHGRSREGRQLREEYAELLPHLQELHRLYKALLKARKERGAIEFETQDTKIIFGPDRKIAEIRPTQRNDAHRMIEECMLCANVAAADFLQHHQLPGLYRVHDTPPPERLEKLRAFLGELGLTLNKGKGDPSPKDYQQLLESIQGRPDFQLIQTVMLRSMSQAVYSAENQGHFGLNYEAYTHFTSPIRRYPDLLVHRAIRSIIRSRRDTSYVCRAGAGTLAKARIYPYDEARLEQLGEQSSMTERRADEATRDVVNWLKCEFMQDRIGEVFPGVVSSATGFGLFVELTGIYVEGLVHVTALPDDYYHFDAVHHRLTGERSGRSFRLGDSVEVRVIRVDLDDRKIDFELVESQPPSRKSRHSGSASNSTKPASGLLGSALSKSRGIKQALLKGATKSPAAEGEVKKPKAAGKTSTGRSKTRNKSTSADKSSGRSARTQNKSSRPKRTGDLKASPSDRSNKRKAKS